MVVEEAGAVRQPGRHPEQCAVLIVLGDGLGLAAVGRQHQDVLAADPL